MKARIEKGNEDWHGGTAEATIATITTWTDGSVEVGFQRAHDAEPST